MNATIILKNVLEYLDETGVPYVLNPHLVSGFDYYTKTVFEVFLEDEHIEEAMKKRISGQSSHLGGGGRYDYLAKTLGGRETPRWVPDLAWSASSGS